MAFHYFYQSQLTEGNYIKRPIVPIKINNYEFTGLVDSGSDVIIIPREIAEALQLPKQGENEVLQLDNTKIKCTQTTLSIEFGKGHEQHNFKTQALISTSPRIIIGRNGFFDKFKITFNEDKNHIIFKHNKDN